jgi:hypothetical protein
MRCQKCSAENSQGSRFCIQCGNPFGHPCQNCGCGNPPEARCGAPLAPAVPAPSEIEARGDNIAGERRHLTVLFCDLVDSTALASQMDPEEWRATIATSHRAAAEAITRYGGRVAKYLV